MRLLWLTPELPFWPGGSGGSTRQFQLIRLLVAAGHEVEVVAPVHPSQRDGVASLRAAGAEVRTVERPDSRPAETLAALRRAPRLALDAVRLPLLAWQVEVFWTSLRPLAEQALAERRPDVVHVEHDWAARWVDDLPLDGIPTVLGLENLSWAYHANRARSAERAPLRLHQQIEARRFARFDRWVLDRYDLLLAMSELDRAMLAPVTRTPAVVVPNGVDTSLLNPGPSPRRPVALFTGTFGYPPNAEALEWLLRDLWPRIAEQVPGAELLVVGRGVPDELARLAGDDVTLAGWVPEMAPWFERASVVLVPIRSGAGTRLKVLDGLASGRAVVSTAMGAEGIDVTPGADVLLADTAEGFCALAARALSDPDLAAGIGAAGRRLAEETYDWTRIAQRLETALADLAGTGRR